MSQPPDPSSSALPPDVCRDVFVVIPAYNEATSLKTVMHEVRAVYPNVVVVDDGSADDTFAVAQQAGGHVLRHIVNRGQGAALQTGIQYALQRGARFVVTFDADGQHCVKDIAALVGPIHRGECDIALGSRFLGRSVNMPASRRLLLRAGVLFTWLVSRVRLTDVHNGLRAFSRRAAEHVDITLDRMAHASELIDMIRNCGLVFREVPVEVRYTEYSLAKGHSARGALKIAFHYLTGRILP